MIGVILGIKIIDVKVAVVRVSVPEPAPALIVMNAVLFILVNLIGVDLIGQDGCRGS